MHLGGNRRWVPLITPVFSFYHLSREAYAKHQRWSKSVLTVDQKPKTRPHSLTFGYFNSG